MTTVRMFLAALLLAGGLLVFLIATIGVFRFDYVLNRMHASAMCDSLGIALITLSGMLYYWDLFATLKLMLIPLFLYLTSPVSAHLIARVEILTNKNVVAHLHENTLPEGKDANT